MGGRSGSVRPACSASRSEPRLGEELRRQQAADLPHRPPRQRVHLAGAVRADDHRHRVRHPRHQLEPGRRDHRERALGPGEQGRVVVAGVVLDQPGHVRQHGAVGEHRLDAAQLGPHRAVPQHPQPARVGGDRPAHRGAVPAGDEHPQVQAGIGVGDLLQAHPGAGADLPGVKIDRAEAVQPGQAEHHLAVERDAAARQAGVPALRDDRYPGVRAQREQRRHLLGAARPQHGRRAARKPARPVHGVAGRRIPGQHVRRPHHGRELPQQAGRQIAGHRITPYRWWLACWRSAAAGWRAGGGWPVGGRLSLVGGPVVVGPLAAAGAWPRRSIVAEGQPRAGSSVGMHACPPCCPMGAWPRQAEWP